MGMVAVVRFLPRTVFDAWSDLRPGMADPGTPFPPLPAARRVSRRVMDLARHAVASGGRLGIHGDDQRPGPLRVDRVSTARLCTARPVAFLRGPVRRQRSVAGKGPPNVRAA